jgi:5-methylcytosine-specific restriction endonuclease McrA
MRKALSVAHLRRLVVMPNRCAYCGIRGCDLEIDHLRPVSRGGDNSFENLAVSCGGCNRKKGSMTLQEVGFVEVPTFADPEAESTIEDVFAAERVFGDDLWAHW